MTNNEVMHFPTREEMRAEAVERMKLFNLHPNVVAEFQQGKLNCSETYGALFWLDDAKKAVVETVETKTGGIVYHTILSNTSFGVMLSCLYVSKHMEEWERDRADMKDGLVFAYVENMSYPDLSELGSIMVKPLAGGLVRTA